ncbi:MAG: glycosyltransferase [Desulfurococcus sp.]|uniref:glycosyltransferase n=1 Tax=Desulfurococcus sp. TaxID=51678 RepID=UPI00317F8304
MRVAVVHDTLNPSGGAERLALYVIKVLRELGYTVDLVTEEKTNWDKVKSLMYEDPRSYINSEVVLPPWRKLPTIYSRYLEWFLRDIVGFTLRLRKRYDLTIVTKQLLVPVLGDIVYIHFPDFYPGSEILYYPERYLQNSFLRVYSLPSRLFSKLLINVFKSLMYRPLVLTNSNFTKRFIEKWLGVKAFVVYPPVDVEKYQPLAKNPEREDLVITVGRIERGKKQHVIPAIARETPGVKYAIIGTVDQIDYFQYVKRLIKKFDLEERVRIYTNLSEDLKVRLLSRAKVYLHTMKYEHFGIAVVEAMAAGSIPIVHRYSGSWIDLVSPLEEDIRYSYTNYDECADIILKKLSNWTLEKAKILSAYATRFNYENFKNSFSSIIIKSHEFFKQ